MRGAVSKVTPKVTKAVTASTRLTCHRPSSQRGLTRPATAATTTAASTARGTWYSAGVSNSRVRTTKKVAATVAQPLLAPAYSVMAERENEVLVAKLPLK